MITRSFFHEDKTINKVYAPNNKGKSIWSKTDRTEKETDESTIITGNFNTPLSKMDKTSRQKINRDIVELNTTMNQMDIIEIYKLLHAITTYIFIKSSHETFAKIYQVLGYLNELKKIEIVHCLLQIIMELNWIPITER